jgi:Transglycosylase SLT domain
MPVVPFVPAISWVKRAHPGGLLTLRNGTAPTGVVGAALAALVAVGLLTGCQPRTGQAEQPRTGRPDASGAAGPAAAPTAGPGAAPTASPETARTDRAEPGPARFAAQVRSHAGRAGINPELLMAILYNEAYKPHVPALERAWQKIQPDAAFGIANMHQAAFDEAKRGRDFAGRDWHELPDDPDLAIKAAAWHLHDLARQLPARWPGGYTRDELLALGYNAGAGSMKAFARGGRPGRVAQSYLDRLRDNWPKAEEALRTP